MGPSSRFSLPPVSPSLPSPILPSLPYHFPLSSRFSLPPVSPILPSPILPSLPPSRFSHPPVSPLSLSPFLPFSLPLVSHSLVSHPLVPSLFGSRNGLATDQLNRKVLAK